MATRDQVLSLLRAGSDYEEIARRLHIRPGLAYLIATGLPADGSDTPDVGSTDHPGWLSSSQHLSNPQPAENPTGKSSVTEWIAARVARDQQMQQAEAARDAAPGEKQVPDGPQDVVDVLGRDHNQVKALLEQLSALPGKVTGGSPAQMSARKSIVDMITVALSRHESVEEEHFWPAVRQALPDGDDRAETALGQEKEGKDVLTALGKLDGDDDEFDQLVEQLTLDARTHVAYEERVFLELKEHLPQEDREALGERIRKAREHAPTRPHPHAPQHSPGVQVAGMAGAAMDAVRDTVGHRPADRLGRADEDSEESTED